MAAQKQTHKLGFYIFLAVDLTLLLFCIVQIFHPIIHIGSASLFNPQGVIAEQEKSLIIKAVLIMLIAVIPVYILLFFFIWKYRADKTGSSYSPNLQSNAGSTLVLWAFPGAIIFALAILNWQSTHALDPYKAIASSKPPITIEVIALQWKWLFIYPQQNIATINFVEFPVNTPLNFEITADAPMSSFWIPQLGSQIYAMAAMSTQLHLMANTTGDFRGLDTEINGNGFSGMKFIARSAALTDFNAWVTSAKNSNNALSLDVYNKLALPSENNPVATYSSVQDNLYNQVMMKYMMPASPDNTSSPMDNMPGMNMQSANQ